MAVYDSYVKDGVPYTVITFPNTLITPTLPNMVSHTGNVQSPPDSANNLTTNSDQAENGMNATGPSMADVMSGGRGSGRGRLAPISSAGGRESSTNTQVDEI